MCFQFSKPSFQNFKKSERIITKKYLWYVFNFLLQRGSEDLLAHSIINGNGMSPIETGMEMVNDAKKVSVNINCNNRHFFFIWIPSINGLFMLNSHLHNIEYKYFRICLFKNRQILPWRYMSISQKCLRRQRNLPHVNCFFTIIRW